MPHFRVEHVELLLSLLDLHLQLLQLSLSLALVEIVLALSEEFLLRHIEELLVGEAERALHLGDLPPQLVVLVLHRREVVNAVVPLLLGGRTLHRERIRLLHEDLRSHTLQGSSKGVGLRLLDVVEGKRVVHLVRAILLSQDYITLLHIDWVVQVGRVGLLASPFTLEFLEVSVGEQVQGALIIDLALERLYDHLDELHELLGHACLRCDLFDIL